MVCVVIEIGIGSILKYYIGMMILTNGSLLACQHAIRFVIRHAVRFTNRDADLPALIFARLFMESLDIIIFRSAVAAGWIFLPRKPKNLMEIYLLNGRAKL